ncbi:MAG TPA: helix-turn-helix domain-containing protein [Longimicrobium sp.]|nr:helix-turn-helix domain-containing protein [Longimicrobium sp.]
MTATLRHEGALVDVLDLTGSGVTAASAARSLAAIDHIPEGAPITLTSPGAPEVPLPSPLAPFIAAVLRELAQGHAVAVVSTAEEISTGAAAELLGVSRPHVAKLVDTGVLPGRKVNRHRRVRLSDVMAFKRRMERRHRLLDELAEVSEELGLYDLPLER